MWIFLTECYCSTAVMICHAAGLGAGSCFVMQEESEAQESKEYRYLEGWSHVCIKKASSGSSGLLHPRKHSYPAPLPSAWDTSLLRSTWRLLRSQEPTHSGVQQCLLLQPHAARLTVRQVWGWESKGKRGYSLPE